MSNEDLFTLTAGVAKSAPAVRPLTALATVAADEMVRFHAAQDRDLNHAETTIGIVRAGTALIVEQVRALADGLHDHADSLERVARWLSTPPADRSDEDAPSDEDLARFEGIVVGTEGEVTKVKATNLKPADASAGIYSVAHISARVDKTRGGVGWALSKVAPSKAKSS